MKPFLLTILFLLLNCSLFAQSLTGKLVDEYQKAIPEVYILNKNTGHHTHSNETGGFSMERISLGDTLQFSCIGYQNRQIVLDNLKALLTVQLQSKPISLEEVVIRPQVDALHVITDIDVQTNPVNSSQDILRKVPGLFIGQHAGGGKAEQIFLRGFDIDHGTDINITVDGMPVNMVSHAHGQGYSDLHFVIPETLDKIDFGKGPYYQNKGNFTTAGYVDFMTKKKLEYSSIKLEAGQFDTYRLLGMFNLVESNDHNAYVATEYLATDGPFESPQNFNRINFFGKYTGMLSNTDKLGVTASYFDSKWDASGQIPQRAVDSGMISRFGAIDDTEGGNTARSNLLINHEKIIDENSSLKSNIYLSQYDFELYSNFTFFLEDPINGDQIKQKEDRTIYGFNSEYNTSFTTNTLNGNWQAGISLRNDQSNSNELSHTLNRRETLGQIKLGDINETNLGAYLGTTVNLNRWTFNPSVRVDYFDFQYNDALLPTYSTQEETKAIISPKFNILYNQTEQLQLYIKTGKGFHSNDTRVVVAEKGNHILPAAYGFDGGFIWKPTPKMLLNLAYWYLYLEQELVYVGDAGIVEPSGKTRRKGLDLSYRYQPLPWLFWNLDANYTHARAIEESKGEDFIPLAPDFTLVSGINIIHQTGFYGSINVRHINSRPANEDNSIVAKGYTVTDLNAGYKRKKYNIGVQVQNLFDTEWNETQFATESKLQFETEPVEEIHFTPGTPLSLKVMIQYNF
ncbi:TonB-dependent receptor plug domain-containing protein [Echinicola sp. CAU 1574]|uniref:TonB-dependent receptor plug domain-containing protein n=1 Tax=Echinicola arenosa TaxID=2774144 RepID=A0ABR9AMK4_9BACT|nr:TonB-dependent receptor [Echinicola arenosa]MBD8490033.1 TonB-dependent receptor plug domain-containing protein [Echinicola arenosa]